MAIAVIGLYNGVTPPSGAYLCNGNNCVLGATPNCVNRFVVSAGSTYTLNGTGGSDTKQLADHVHVIGSHTHTGTPTMQTPSAGNALRFYTPSTYYNIGDMSHTHSVSWKTLNATAANSDVAGATAALENRPLYYGLTFIMFDGTILPVGAIVYCNSSVPGHFTLCDGNNGTPNLMDRFMLAAGNSYGLGWTGGENTNTPPSHTHTFSAHQHDYTGSTTAGSGSVSCTNGTPQNVSGATPTHTHAVTGTSNTATGTNNAAASAAVGNMPTYIGLYPVMKIS